MKRSVGLYKVLIVLFAVFALWLSLRVEVLHAEDTEVAQDWETITLSPEQLAEHFKELYSCRIHTVVWHDKNFLIAVPSFRAREDKDSPGFQILSWEEEGKHKKGNYVEITAVVKKKVLGANTLDDVQILSSGDEAKAVLDKIDGQESVSPPDIKAIISKVKVIRDKISDGIEQEVAIQFCEDMQSAKEEYGKSDDFLTLTPEQLSAYSSYLGGKKFHTVFTANRVWNKYFTVIFNEDKPEVFRCYVDYPYKLDDFFDDGDLLEVVGDVTVEDKITYTSCQILSTGQEARDTLDMITANWDKGQTEIDQIVEKEESVSQPIKINDQGLRVKALQKELIEQGYLDDVADGKFGPKTQKAVEEYQKAHGLEVSGMANTDTLRSIFPDGLYIEVQIKEGYTKLQSLFLDFDTDMSKEEVIAIVKKNDMRVLCEDGESEEYSFKFLEIYSDNEPGYIEYVIAPFDPNRLYYHFHGYAPDGYGYSVQKGGRYTLMHGYMSVDYFDTGEEALDAALARYKYKK